MRGVFADQETRSAEDLWKQQRERDEDARARAILEGRRVVRIVRDIEDESVEFQSTGLQLAKRRPLRRLWHRLWDRIAFWRRRGYVETLGMGRMRAVDYWDMVKFARDTGDARTLGELKRK